MVQGNQTLLEEYFDYLIKMYNEGYVTFVKTEVSIMDKDHLIMFSTFVYTAIKNKQLNSDDFETIMSFC